MTDDALAVGSPIAAERGGFGYRDITEALIADIRDHRWGVGDRLPTELELTDRFGASRNTVRESLRELEMRGYISRRRGTRSVLVATRPTDSFVNSVRSIEELLQYSSRTASRLVSLDLVVATNDLAERLGVAADTRWWRAQFLRLPREGGLPIGFSDIYFDERYAEVIDQLDEDVPVYQLIERHYDVAFRRVQQTVEAIAANPSVAQLLQVKSGSPLLAVRTEFVTGEGELVEIGFGHFPPDRYRIEIILERGAAVGNAGRSVVPPRL